jgi:CRISPR system Cascade subunit CasA
MLVGGPVTPPTYDLREEPWLPVRRGAETEMIGLRDLFRRAHELEDLALPVPPAAAGLLRILYAISARVTGLDRSVGWSDRQLDALDEGRFDGEAVDAYFDRFANRFNLFGDRPWMQDPRLARQCPKASGVNKLVFDRPAGNTQVWFGHHTDTAPVPLAAPQAAWYLVAQLYYGASGRCTSRAAGGQQLANMTAGPLRSAMSYHPLGRTLFESLLAGLPAPDDSTRPGDRCPWERDELPDPLGRPDPLTWPGGMLTGRHRHAILLVPAPDGRTVVNVYLTWAWRAAPEDRPDPYVVYRRSKQRAWYQLPAKSSRALWRDVDALLADNDDEDGRSRRPAIMTDWKDLRIAPQIRIRAYGFDQDGQAKDNQWFTATTPPVLQWLKENDDEAAYGIRELRMQAEMVARRLDTVLKAAWREMVNVTGGERPPEGPWPARAAGHYWSRAEAVFWGHVERRSFDLGRPSFLRLAHDAIEYAAGAHTSRRVVKAVTAAHRRLSARPTERRSA